MNFIDAAIIVLAITMFASRQHLSFAYYFVCGLFSFLGFMLAVYIAPIIGKADLSDLQKGVFFIVLAVTLTLLLYLTASMTVARKLRIIIIQSRFFKLDKLMGIPAKAAALLIIIASLSQTLIYIPILALQFMAQGSTLLYFADKKIPDNLITDNVSRISPNQFSNITLEYDPKPITTELVQDTGEFRDVINRISPSVVKVSGKRCSLGVGSGSGFVAGKNLVITNAHVLTGSSSAFIKTQDSVYPATPIKIDKNRDLAVLYSKFISEPTLKISPKDIKNNQKVAGLGFPSAGDLNDVIGIVKFDEGHKSLNTKLDREDVYTINQQAFGGFSGGPVIDRKGQLVGVIVAAGGGKTVIIRASLALKLLESAKQSLKPTATTMCEVNKKSI